MAHHHRASNHPHDEAKGTGAFKVDSIGATASNLNPSSHEAEKVKGQVPAQKKKRIFDYEIAGFPWPMVVLLFIMVTAILVVVLKAMGIF